MDNATFSNFAAVDLERMPSLARGEVRVQRVPGVAATPASLKGYGHLVREFAKDR